MNVKFSKDELAMVYQYAADTKQETLAGLREIVPVIRDRQARAKAQAREKTSHSKRKEPDRERS